MPARSDVVTLSAIATVVAATDQLTKSAITSRIGPRQERFRLDLIDNLIGLEYTENHGAAFGLFAGLTPVLAVASIVVLCGLLIHFSRQPRPPLWETVAIGSIAGGAVGNLVDRVRLGYVVDFFSVGAWPNFNIADSAITIGVLILLWSWMRSGVSWRPVTAIDRER